MNASVLVAEPPGSPIGCDSETRYTSLRTSKYELRLFQFEQYIVTCVANLQPW
ncbi:MAG: hypothetical protein ABR548_04455 [Actinomycetota bacterium]